PILPRVSNRPSMTLSSLPLRHRQRPLIAADVSAHPFGTRLVETMALLHWLRPAEDVLGRSAGGSVHQADCSCFVYLRISSRAIWRLWTSSGPSASRRVRMPA